jgi:hypothetical protein
MLPGHDAWHEAPGTCLALNTGWPGPKEDRSDRVPAGLLIGGGAVTAAIVTTTKLLLLTTVVVHWPLLVAGLVVGTILSWFLVDVGQDAKSHGLVLWEGDQTGVTAPRLSPHEKDCIASSSVA